MDTRPNQTDKELALRRYFEIVNRPSAKTPVLLLIIGTLFVLNSLAHVSSSFGSEAKTAWFILLVGLGLAVAGVVQLSSIDQRYKQALAALQPQPPDTQIDAWFHESRDCLIMHAKNRLNLFGPESDLVNPLVIEVPTLDTSTYGISREDLSWHVGNDSVLRFSVHKFIIIYLTERHLAAYTCDYNFIRDISLNETTREYQYQDIVSVATYEWSSAFTLPTGQKLSTSQIFRLSVASGEYIEVRLDNDQLRKMTQLEEVPAIGADQAVTTIRALLRDRKGMAA